MEELISIVVPMYNIEAYAPQCIDSLMNQTWRNIEIILIDDGSSDNTPDICDDYAKKDARITVIHQRNGGVSKARNAGLAVARGTLIGFCDGDDWVEPDWLEQLANVLTQENAQVAMCDYFEYLPNAEEPLRHKVVDDVDTTDRVGALFRVLERNGYFTAIWNKLFRKDVLYVNGEPDTFDTALAVGEDEVWLVKTLLRAERIALTGAGLYHWRCNMDSATRKEVINDRKMSILMSKATVIELVRPYGKDLERLCKSRLLNDSYHLRVLAYESKRNDYEKQICKSFRPVCIDWLLCNDVPLLRKGKVIVMEMMIRLHFPIDAILKVYNLRRKYAVDAENT